MMRWRRRAVTDVMTVVAVGMMTTVGCTVVEIPGGNGGGGTTTPPPNSVTVVLSNQHPTAAVDVEAFATPTTVSDFASELFVDANKITDIGFAGTGLIPAGDDETLTLSCSEAVVIGTSGARFIDPDTNELLGTGAQRVMVQDVAFSCGDTLTFEFFQDGTAFVSRVTVE